MEGKGNEMAFQQEEQMQQYCLCNENVGGEAELASMNGVQNPGLKYVWKK